MHCPAEILRLRYRVCNLSFDRVTNQMLTHNSNSAAGAGGEYQVQAGFGWTNVSTMATELCAETQSH